MDFATVKQFEREFYVVWKALAILRRDTRLFDAVQLELDRTADAVQRLMVAADCIDPAITLDGSQRSESFSQIAREPAVYPGPAPIS